MVGHPDERDRWVQAAVSGTSCPYVFGVPRLEVKRAHTLKNPYPHSAISVAGVSYRTVERVLASFISEPGLMRVILFSRAEDECSEKELGGDQYKARKGTLAWYPGYFGGLWVTRQAVPGASPIYEPGRDCRPEHVWWETTPEVWTALCKGEREFARKAKWRWGLGDAVMEWFRSGDKPTLVTPGGRARWARARRSCATGASAGGRG